MANIEKKYCKEKNIQLVIFLVAELSLFLYTLFSNIECINIPFKFFIHLFPFIIFYEGVYFFDKELNYAQIFKLFAFTLIGSYGKYFLSFSFSFFFWLLTVYKNVSVWALEYEQSFEDKNRKKRISLYVNFVFNFFTLLSVILFLKACILDKIILFASSFIILGIFLCQETLYKPLKNESYEFLIYKNSTGLKYKVATTHISGFAWIVPTLFGFLYLQSDILSAIVTSCCFLFYSFYSIKILIKRLGKDIIREYAKSCLCIIVILSFFPISHTKLPDIEKLKNIAPLIVTFISTDLIFNFTAMFILLQENYGKYNSVFLLRYVVGLETITAVTVVPGIMIVLYSLSIIPADYYLLYSVFCVAYCLFCSIYLLYNLKRVWNDMYLLALLMSKTSKDMFYYYKTNQLSPNENYIDSVLRIITNSVAKKEYDILPNILQVVLLWLDENKDRIEGNRENNRFYHFMNVLVDSLIATGSPIIVNQYAEQIYSLFYKDFCSNTFQKKKIEYIKTLKELHIFYYSLYRLIKHYIRAKEHNYDDILHNLYKVYTYNIKYNFLQLEFSQRKGVAILESENYRDFDFYYMEFYVKIIDEAIENENFSFLKRLYLFSAFYQLGEGQELNSNHLKILHKLTYLYSKVLKECNYEKEVLHRVLSEYKSLIHYLSYLKIDSILSELMGNVIYNSIQNIYVNLLQTKCQITIDDLEFLYEIYYDFGRTRMQDSRYLKLFLFVVASYFEYVKIEEEKFYVNQIWEKIEHLEDLFSRQGKTDYLNILNTKKFELENKYPEVKMNYDEYRIALTKGMEAFQNAMKKYD